jgi:hypothetical protein
MTVDAPPELDGVLEQSLGLVEQAGEFHGCPLSGGDYNGSRDRCVATAPRM